MSKETDGQWSSKILSSSHNGLDLAEVRRVRDAHPGEEGMAIGFRRLGAIMATRGEHTHASLQPEPMLLTYGWYASALGHHPFKLPCI